MSLSDVRQISYSGWAIASCVVRCGWTGLGSSDRAAVRDAAVEHTEQTGHETANEWTQSIHYQHPSDADDEER